VIVPTLATQLARAYGRSFAEKNLRRMVQFAATFSDEPIVVTLSRQLSWSHFIALLPLKDPLQRKYYAQMCFAERWSVRTLRGRIDSMLYERTALSQQPDALIAQELATMQDAQRMSPNLVMRDPYILDFLGLRDTWQEATWRQRSSGKWNRFCWNWASALPSSRASSVSTRVAA
jgi:hypothetical protein